MMKMTAKSTAALAHFLQERSDRSNAAQLSATKVTDQRLLAREASTWHAAAELVRATIIDPLLGEGKPALYDGGMLDLQDLFLMFLNGRLEKAPDSYGGEGDVYQIDLADGHLLIDVRPATFGMMVQHDSGNFWTVNMQPDGHNFCHTDPAPLPWEADGNNKPGELTLTDDAKARAERCDPNDCEPDDTTVAIEHERILELASLLEELDKYASMNADRRTRLRAAREWIESPNGTPTGGGK